MLAAWRGQKQEASELIEAHAQEGAAHGTGIAVDFAACVSAVLHNGLGRYDAARDAARSAFEREPVGYGHLLVPDLAEGRPGPATRSWSRPRCTGCPNGPGSPPPAGH